MKQNEENWDKLLNIKTSGRDDSISNHINYPYEPTPYSVLERLSREGYLTKKNTLLDYGCGKGRVDFYLSYQTKCHSIGIDYNERMVESAVNNKEKAVSGNRVQFLCENATMYQVPTEVDTCYFFNPFSVEVLKSVMARIMDSYYEMPRTMRLFFYYPSDEYVAYLMSLDELMFIDEINCEDLFEGHDRREIILVYEIEVV